MGDLPPPPRQSQVNPEGGYDDRTARHRDCVCNASFKNEPQLKGIIDPSRVFTPTPVFIEWVWYYPHNQIRAREFNTFASSLDINCESG